MEVFFLGIFMMKKLRNQNIVVSLRTVGRGHGVKNQWIIKT